MFQKSNTTIDLFAAGVLGTGFASGLNGNGEAAWYQTAIFQTVFPYILFFTAFTLVLPLTFFFLHNVFIPCFESIRFGKARAQRDRLQGCFVDPIPDSHLAAVLRIPVETPEKITRRDQFLKAFPKISFQLSSSYFFCDQNQPVRKTNDARIETTKTWSETKMKNVAEASEIHSPIIHQEHVVQVVSETKRSKGWKRLAQRIITDSLRINKTGSQRTRRSNPKNTVMRQEADKIHRQSYQ